MKSRPGPTQALGCILLILSAAPALRAQTEPPEIPRDQVQLLDLLEGQRNATLVGLYGSQGDFIVSGTVESPRQTQRIPISNLLTWRPRDLGSPLSGSGDSAPQQVALFSLPLAALAADAAASLPDARGMEAGGRYADGELRELRIEITGPLGVLAQYFFDPGGIQTSRRIFGYRADGRLVSMGEYRQENGDSSSELRYRWQGDRLSQIAEASGGDLTLRNYDAEGRQTGQLYYRGGILVWQETWSYPVPGNDQGYEVERIYTAKDAPVDRRVSQYSAQGALVSQEEYRGTAVVRREQIQYREESQDILSRIITQKGFVQRTDYLYAGDELRGEEIRENGELVMRVSYPDGETSVRIEEIFRGSALVLRIYYRDGRRYMEEDISQGRVVRTRRYEISSGEQN